MSELFDTRGRRLYLTREERELVLFPCRRRSWMPWTSCTASEAQRRRNGGHGVRLWLWVRSTAWLRLQGVIQAALGAEEQNIAARMWL